MARSRVNEFATVATATDAPYVRVMRSTRRVNACRTA